MSATRSTSAWTAALLTVVAPVYPKFGGVPQNLVALSVVLVCFFVTFPFESAVRQLCAVPGGSVALPAPLRQALFSLPCALATSEPSLLIVFRHFCWFVLCTCARAPDALIDRRR